MDATVYGARLAGLRAMVGRTPLLEIEAAVEDRRFRVYAKYEQRNMTGSVKDRMALEIIEAACRGGALRPGDMIAEATSGNTGVSFAALGRALGHPVRIYMPDWMSRERVALISALGAEVVPVSRAEGGFLGSIAMADAFAQERGRVFLPHQFDNPANVSAHERTTGPEILAQLGLLGLSPGAFVAGVGTGGTVMGVGRCLRKAQAGVKVYALEPESSPTLRTGRKVGQHRIQGISDEFVPSIVRLEELDGIIDVADGDAILMAQALARAGLGVGISSGANFIGALKILLDPDAPSVVVTIFPDSNKKYLSTDLFREEPVRPAYLAPRTRVLGWRAVECPEGVWAENQETAPAAGTG